MATTNADYLAAVKQTKTAASAMKIASVWLRELRGPKRSAQGVARDLGWSLGGVRNLERGGSIPSLDRLRRLDTYYGCGGMLCEALTYAAKLRRSESGDRSTVKLASKEPTMAELDAMIAEQYPTMPRSWEPEPEDSKGASRVQRAYKPRVIHLDAEPGGQDVVTGVLRLQKDDDVMFPTMFEMMPMHVEPPKPDPLYFFRKYMSPAVMDSRRVILTDPVDLHRELLELLNEIELDACNRAIAAMYRDVGGEG